MSSDRSAERRDVSAMRATAHPVRLQILSLLTGAEMSAAEVARELDLTHANASYHLRLLAERGLLVEAGEEKIRGGVAKRYRHPWDQADTLGPKATRDDAVHYVRVMGEELARRFTARESGTRSFLTDAEMWVAPEVWSRVERLVRQASRLIHAEAQPPHTAGTVHVNLTAAAFEMSSSAPSQDETR
jgi:DNA-binding transcriptional ArsR family regulator